MELEINQASQPPTPRCPLNMVRKDKEWMKVGSKWKCKVGTCIVTLCQIVVDQAFEGGAWLGGKKRLNLESLQLLKKVLDINQDHVKMIARILGNAMAI